MEFGLKRRPRFIEALAPVAATGPVGAIIFGVAIVAQLLGGLFGLFGGGGGPSMADLSKLRNDTAQAIDTTYRFSWKSVFALGGLLKVFDFVWTHIIKQLVSTVVQVAKQLVNLVQRVITPMLNAIHRIREILNEVYDKFLRPVLNVIQHVRRYLQILKALHVPFADKLDGILARVQGKIIGPFLWTLRTLNGYGRWINLVVTATATIQRPIFIRTMYAYQRDWVNLFWTGQATVGGRAGAPSVPALAVQPDANQVASDFGDLARTDGGSFAQPAGVSQDTFRAIVGV